MYVICLSSKRFSSDSEVYGYYAGQYTFQGELYPVCDNNVTDRTRKYKSFKRAESAATRCKNKFGYVIKATVEEWEE